MTGEELLQELLKLGPEKLKLPVWTEGCDCERTATKVTTYDDSRYIMIETSDGYSH